MCISILKKNEISTNQKKYIIGKIHLYDIEKVIESF